MQVLAWLIPHQFTSKLNNKKANNGNIDMLCIGISIIKSVYKLLYLRVGHSTKNISSFPGICHEFFK
jgi:hypothetical protein